MSTNIRINQICKLSVSDERLFSILLIKILLNVNDNILMLFIDTESKFIE